MSTVIVALNELSFVSASQELADDALLDSLLRSFVALRRCARKDDENRILAWLTSKGSSIRLPSGNSIAATLCRMRSSPEFQVSADLLATILRQQVQVASEVAIDFVSLPVAVHEQKEAEGLTVAYRSNGIAWSLSNDPWKTDSLRVEILRETESQFETICNCWSTQIGPTHREALRRHIDVLPRYEDPGHHDPDSPSYVVGKSQIPKGAPWLLRHAVPSSDSTWWALCEHGFFHRFQGTAVAQEMTVHWNGTTNPRATQVTNENDVPSNVRSILNMRGTTHRCECREL